ncbi:MAG: aspartyl protease family protein [Candidatus Coatesbacteria bacterium]|nr:MAG: aspartyl protease family protein [Candidatus Coatesbacteria bacterium]
MRKGYFNIAVLSLTAAAFAANAATLEEVLDMHKAALGGAAVDSLHSLVTMSTIEGMGMSGSDVTGAMKPDSFVNEVHLGPITHVTGTDGKTAWQIDYNGKVSELVGRDEVMVNISAYFANYRYLAPEPGTAALVEETNEHYVVEYTAFPTNPVRAFINKETGLTDRTELDSELGTSVTAFSDYREVNGLMVPFRIEQTTGADTIVAVTEDVIIDAGVTAETFAMPVGDFKDYVFEGDAASTTVPLDFVGKAPCVPVRIVDSEPLNFLFDTGASISVLDASVADELGFETEGELGGTGAGGTDTASLALVPSMSVGGVAVMNPMVAVFDISAISELAGKKIDGVLGADICRRFVVELDYENENLTIYEPDEFDPPIDAEFIPITYLGGVGIPLVSASVDDYEGEFVLDTGNSGSLVFHKPYADEHGLLGRFDKKVATSAYGVGGFFTNYSVRAEGLGLGHYVIDDPVVEITTAEEGAMAMENVAGNIGAGVLSRFTLYLDYRGNRLGLIPNSFFDDPFPYNRTGFTLARTEAGYVVKAIIGESPAAKAGMEKGDVITAVDGAPAGEISFSRFSEIVSQPAGTDIEISFERGGETFVETLTLKELL